MSDEPKKPGGLSRRDFTTKAPVAALSAAMGGNAENAVTDQSGVVNLLIDLGREMSDLRKATGLIMNTANDYERSLHENHPDAYFYANRMPTMQNEALSLAKDVDNKMAKVRATYAKIRPLLKTGVACNYDSPLLKEATEDGVIKADKLEEVFARVISGERQTLNKHNETYPKLFRRYEVQSKAWQNLVQAYRNAFPSTADYAPHEILEMIHPHIAAEHVPAGVDWAEHFSTPQNTAPYTDFLREDNRKFAESYAKRGEEERTKYARDLGDKIGHKTQEKDGFCHLSVPNPSDELYIVLRKLATSYDKHAEFPAKRDLFIAKLDNGAEAPVGVRVPCNYAAKLPEHFAKQLESALGGSFDFEHMRKGASNLEGASKDARRQAKLYGMLADDLDRLKTLLSGKWSTKTRKENSPTQRS